MLHILIRIVSFAVTIICMPNIPNLERKKQQQQYKQIIPKHRGTWSSEESSPSTQERAQPSHGERAYRSSTVFTTLKREREEK